MILQNYIQPNTPVIIKRYIYVILIEQNYGFVWETVSTIDADQFGQPKNLKAFNAEYKAWQRTGWATRKLFFRMRNPFYPLNK